MNKEKDILSIFPKFTQWENIEYAWDFQCPLGCCEIGGTQRKPDLVGWCETPQGYMLVFECPGFSSTKYRVTASLNAGGYKREVIIYTNTLYQVGDTVKIVKK